MGGLQPNLIRKLVRGSLLLQQSLVVCTCITALSVCGQAPGKEETVSVTVALLPTYTGTTGSVAKDLQIVSGGLADHAKASSWLYFDARALPADVRVTGARLQLTPKEADDKSMTVTVASRRASANRNEPLSYDEMLGTIVNRISGANFETMTPGEAATIGSASCTVAKIRTSTSFTCKEDLGRHYNIAATLPGAAQAVVNTYPDTTGRDTLRSAPILTDAELARRSDSVEVPLDGLVESDGESRYIGLVLLPQGSASRRVYYGLDGSPNQLPRLLVTYKRAAPKAPACAGDPSALASFQADGRMADIGSCPFLATTEGTESGEYSVRPIEAAWTLTQAPVVYGNGLFVVQDTDSETRIIELNPLGGVIGYLRLGAKGEVIPGSLMVVDRFGRITIITTSQIFDVQLEPNGGLPAQFDKVRQVRSFTFDALPKAVVAGPDGSLYIVKQGIFALNPDVVAVKDNGAIQPRMLWRIPIADEDDAKITLSPDGHFLYALASVAGVNGVNRSRLLAINAQTGKEVELPAGEVNVSGSAVTWVSGPQFSSNRVGETIRVGTQDCEIREISSPTLLHCTKSLDTRSGVPWALFSGALKSCRNPVVARGLNGVDFVVVTGNSGSGATVVGASNTPVDEDGVPVGKLTALWKYPLPVGSDVGQPILDPARPHVTDRGPDLTGKKVYFLLTGAGPSKIIAVSALKGEGVDGPWGTALSLSFGSYGNPVMTSDGKVAFWADNNLYNLAPQGKPLALTGLNQPQLMFGPSGTLYAAYRNSESRTEVSALVPSSQQSDTGPAMMYSPTHLYVSGSTARQGNRKWTLGARGSVILGDNFSVDVGESLTVCVQANGAGANECQSGN